MKNAFVALVIGLLMAVMAAPAAAHEEQDRLRDPFRPAISEDEPAPGATNGVTFSEPEPQPAPVSGGSPNTGFDPQPWLAAAYALIAFGAGAVVLSRHLRATA